MLSECPLVLQLKLAHQDLLGLALDREIVRNIAQLRLELLHLLLERLDDDGVVHRLLLRVLQLPPELRILLRQNFILIVQLLINLLGTVLRRLLLQHLLQALDLGILAHVAAVERLHRLA